MRNIAQATALSPRSRRLAERRATAAKTGMEAALARVAFKLCLHEAVIVDGMAYSVERGLDRDIEDAGGSLDGFFPTRVGVVDVPGDDEMPLAVNRQASIARVIQKLAAMDQERIEGLEDLLDKDLQDFGLSWRGLDACDLGVVMERTGVRP